MSSSLSLRLAALCLAAPAVLTAPAARADDTASFAVETEVKLVSDQRNRGISDSALRPGAQLSVQMAHESGFIALAQLSTVSKKSYLDGNGTLVLLAGGWRGGDADGWHYGAGFATELFPGAQFEAPHGFDPVTGTPLDVRTTKYDTSYAVLELGWGPVDARVLNVVSKNYRGADTGGVCGTLLALRADPTAGLACYGRGDHTSRGSWLFDLGYKARLTGTTTLSLHAGHQRIRHFSEADFTDYSVGITTRQWGFDWGAEAVTTHTRARELFQVVDGNRVRALDNDQLVVSVSRKF